MHAAAWKIKGTDSDSFNKNGSIPAVSPWTQIFKQPVHVRVRNKERERSGT